MSIHHLCIERKTKTVTQPRSELPPKKVILLFMLFIAAHTYALLLATNTGFCLRQMKSKFLLVLDAKLWIRRILHSETHARTCYQQRVHTLKINTTRACDLSPLPNSTACQRPVQSAPVTQWPRFKSWQSQIERFTDGGASVFFVLKWLHNNLFPVAT